MFTDSKKIANFINYSLKSKTNRRFKKTFLKCVFAPYSPTYAGNRSRVSNGDLIQRPRRSPSFRTSQNGTSWPAWHRRPDEHVRAPDVRAFPLATSNRNHPMHPPPTDRWVTPPPSHGNSGDQSYHPFPSFLGSNL